MYLTCPLHLAQKACGGSCTHLHKPGKGKKVKVTCKTICFYLNHGEVLAVLGVKLVVAALHDGELADVVVDRLLAGRRPLQQSETQNMKLFNDRLCNMPT